MLVTASAGANLATHASDWQRNHAYFTLRADASAADQLDWARLIVWSRSTAGAGIEFHHNTGQSMRRVRDWRGLYGEASPAQGELLFPPPVEPHRGQPRQQQRR